MLLGSWFMRFWGFFRNLLKFLMLLWVVFMILSVYPSVCRSFCALYFDHFWIYNLKIEFCQNTIWQPIVRLGFCIYSPEALRLNSDKDPLILGFFLLFISYISEKLLIFFSCWIVNYKFFKETCPIKLLKAPGSGSNPRIQLFLPVKMG
jgi:hypothetical protein